MKFSTSIGIRLIKATAKTVKAYCSFNFRTSDLQPKPAPEKGPNVCAFPKVKPQIVLRRNATFVRTFKIVDCGIPSFPELECNEER